MCFVIWLHCFGAEGGQKAVGMCWEKSCLQDHESICNVCFNALIFKLWWDKSTVQIEFISGQWRGSTAKDPEFVQIICFDNALQESYWPLASDLHWSYELMPKRYCSKTADFFSCQSTLQLQRDWCWWHFFSFNFHESTLTCFISYILKKH